MRNEITSKTVMIKTFNKIQHFGFKAARSFSKDIIKKQNCEESIKFGVYDIVNPQKVSGQLSVPTCICKPPYAIDPPMKPLILTEPEIKDDNQIESMRQSCFFAKEILQQAKLLVQPGVTTDFIDKELHEMIISNGAYPSPLNYNGFPKSICTSVNNISAHGIPDDRPLKDGDIVNIDITVYLNGYHGDCSQTFQVGDVDDEGRRLIAITNECLERSISICKPGEPFRSIGRLIEAVAKKNGFNVIPCLAGHGIGTYFHGPPDIFHFDHEYSGVMEPGITFTIEPALTQGSQEVQLLEDGWSIATVDNARTAQAEHTILITETGSDVLT